MRERERVGKEGKGGEGCGRGSFMDVSRVFQRSFKKTFKVFQKKFHVAWHSSQFPEQKEGLFRGK